jgi:hypothetical protein
MKMEHKGQAALWQRYSKEMKIIGKATLKQRINETMKIA